jgi:hypothetical protein
VKRAKREGMVGDGCVDPWTERCCKNVPGPGKSNAVRVRGWLLRVLSQNHLVPVLVKLFLSLFLIIFPAIV